MVKKRWIASFLAACMMLTGCAGKGNDAAQKDVHTNGEYLVETIKMPGGDRGAPNPFLQKAGGPGDQKVRLIWDSLINEGEDEITPWLAKEYKVEGNTYTFTLNDNAKWHDGQPVTAEDVAFTVEYYKKHTPVQNLIVSGSFDSLVEAKALNDKTVAITVDENVATMLNFIGSMYILPKHIWENVEDPLKFTDEKAFIGCGLYKYKSYDAASGSYEYEAFEDYYGPKQAAKYIQFVPVSDEVLAFENHEIDLATVPTAAIDKYKSDEDIGFINKEDDMVYKLLINFDKVPALSDLETRKALYQAINLQEIVDKVLLGYGTAGSAGHVSPNSRYYNNQVVKYDYDVEAAKKVLENKNISFTITAPSSSMYVKMCEVIKMNLAQVGVTVNIKSVESGITSLASKGEYEVALIGHGTAARMPDYLRTVYSSKYKNTNSGHAFCGPIGWDSEKITQLGEDSLKQLDENKRIEIFKEMQVEISKEIPVIVLATHTTPYMYRKSYYSGWAKSYDYQQFDYCRVSYIQK